MGARIDASAVTVVATYSLSDVKITVVMSGKTLAVTTPWSRAPG